MQCPSCKNVTLVEKDFADGKGLVCRCPQCKGGWFPQGELAKLLAKRAASYFEIPRISLATEERQCPCCHQALFNLCYPGTPVLIDMCKSCRGVWLDEGEWTQINTVRTHLLKSGMKKQKTEHVQKAPGPEPGSAAIKSYAADIPGIKGSLLRFIDRAIDNLLIY